MPINIFVAILTIVIRRKNNMIVIWIGIGMIIIIAISFIIGIGLAILEEYHG